MYLFFQESLVCHYSICIYLVINSNTQISIECYIYIYIINKKCVAYSINSYHNFNHSPMHKLNVRINNILIQHNSTKPT